MNDAKSTFPPLVFENYLVSEGLVLRDYFAAAALQALLQGDRERTPERHQRYAEQAYEYADAMIKARNEPA